MSKFKMTLFYAAVSIIGTSWIAALATAIVAAVEYGITSQIQYSFYAGGLVWLTLAATAFVFKETLNDQYLFDVVESIKRSRQ